MPLVTASAPGSIRASVPAGALISIGRHLAGFGILVRALGVLGLDGDLDLLARDDELGRRMQDASIGRPRRATASER
jgi:hypothetical protein